MAERAAVATKSAPGWRPVAPKMCKNNVDDWPEVLHMRPLRHLANVVGSDGIVRSSEKETLNSKLADAGGLRAARTALDTACKYKSVAAAFAKQSANQVQSEVAEMRWPWPLATTCLRKKEGG